MGDESFGLQEGVINCGGLQCKTGWESCLRVDCYDFTTSSTDHEHSVQAFGEDLKELHI